MATDSIWWDEDADGLYRYVMSIRDLDRARRREILAALKAYHRKLRGTTPQARATMLMALQSGGKPANVVRSIVASLMAGITHTRPVPSVVTKKGDPKRQARAKATTGFTGAVITRSDGHAVARDVVRDSMLAGTGLGRVRSYVDGEGVGRITIERVFPWEVLVDPKDGYYGDPMAMHYISYVPTQVLAAKYPKQRAAIEASSERYTEDAGDDWDIFQLDGQVRYTLVVESWRRASETGVSGTHIVTVDGAILAREPWESTALPFFWYHWGAPTEGFWGDSLISEIGPLNNEYNELLTKIAKAFYFNGVPRISYEKGSIDPKDITNSPKGAFIPRAMGSAPPTNLTQAILSSEIYAHLDRVYSLIFEISGASQMAAQSKKPAGLVSGKAITEFNDIETRRFVLQGQAYEKLFVRIGTLIVEEAKRMEARGVEVETEAADGKYLEDFRWSKCSMLDSAFLFDIFPVSSLPKNPALKIQAVRDLMADGAITDMGTYLRLLDMPDLAEELSVLTAGEDLVKYAVSRITEDGVMVPPDEYTPLPFALRYAVAKLADARQMKEEPENTLMLRQYVDAIASKIKEVSDASSPQPSPDAQPVPGGGAPDVPSPGPAAG